MTLRIHLHFLISNYASSLPQDHFVHLPPENIGHVVNLESFEDLVVNFLEAR